MQLLNRLKLACSLFWFGLHASRDVRVENQQLRDLMNAAFEMMEKVILAVDKIRKGAR